MTDARRGRTGKARPFDARRAGLLLLGLVLFLAVLSSPPWPHAVDHEGETVALTPAGKASLGLFCLAAIWWGFEVVPIGVTGIAVGVLQALFFIRPARAAFADFLAPPVWFILGSLVIGMAFTRTGLTRRMAYRVLVLAGERTSMIYLACFVMTASLTLVMAHTAVAAVVFPLHMIVYSLYSDDERPTRFGKGLFIGMAFTAGVGSIITLLGAARGPVALGFYEEIVGEKVTFLQLSCYMFPLGAAMVALLWGFFMLFFRPERGSIPGLRERSRRLHRELGAMSSTQVLTLVIVFGAILVLCLRSFVPALEDSDRSAVILVAVILFFVFRILGIRDLEELPWNTILLFGGATSMGFCLYETKAAEWLAVQLLALLGGMPWFLFVMGVALVVLMLTNLIMNVVAVAITLPVALVMAPYLGVAQEVVLFASLATAGMPFLLLIGAAPNAIAYGSGQFRPREFFWAGVPASLLLLVLLSVFVAVIWPAMGMAV